MDFSALPLRDWHDPAAVGLWPPAAGWWVVLVSGVVLIVGAAWWWRRLRRPTVKKLARAEFERIRRDPDLSATDRVRQLSILLRRVCLSLYPRSESARLTGTAWLRFLEKDLDEPAFSEGAGKVLLDAPYRREADIDCDLLVALCEKWISALPEGPVSAVRSTSEAKR
ncbi:MAG: DUF4381 domain-containing protein [Gammaproteobacteria bacterium]